MNYKVAAFPQFEKDLKKLSKKYPSIKADVRELEKQLMGNPRMGDEIIKDCYKIRMSISSKNKGKSGGARIITYIIVQDSLVLLLTIYDKSEKENISIAAIKELLKNINDI